MEIGHPQATIWSFADFSWLPGKDFLLINFPRLVEVVHKLAAVQNAVVNAERKTRSDIEDHIVCECLI